jgi:carbon-monoxide dehydrogenase medium subunit
MLAYGAEMIAGSTHGRRVVPARDFFRGIYEISLHPNEILLEVRVPVAPTGQRFGFAETSLRRGDFALCCAVALITVDAGVVTEAAVAVAGIANCVQRLSGIESGLLGTSPDAIDLDAVEVLARGALPAHGDARVPQDYKIDLLGTNVRRSVAGAIGRNDQ